MASPQVKKNQNLNISKPKTTFASVARQANLMSVGLVLLFGQVEEVDVVEELVVGQGVEQAAHVQDQAWNAKWF